MNAADHLAPERLDALIDGVLEASDRGAAEAHVAGCEACAEELARIRAVRAAIGALASQGPDARFEARLREALDREDARLGRARGARRTSARRWLAAGLAASMAVFALWLARDGNEELPAQVAVHALRGASASTLAEDAALLEKRFASAELGFAARVLDLGMMGWSVSGGDVTELAGRRAIEVIYRDAAGRALLCAMLRASAGELPGDALRFTENGIAFFSFARGDVTVVAWAEGDVLCLLAAALPAEDVRALAVAKAMLPPGR